MSTCMSQSWFTLFLQFFLYDMTKINVTLQTMILRSHKLMSAQKT